MKKLILLTLITSLIFSTIGCEKTAKSPPNIVLIMVDDLNDSPEIFNGHPQTAVEGGHGRLKQWLNSWRAK